MVLQKITLTTAVNSDYDASMNEEQSARIDAALADFLSKEDPKNVPYAKINEFVEHLRAERRLSQAEAVEVQSRLLRSRFDLFGLSPP